MAQYRVIRDCYTNNKFYHQGQTVELPDDMEKSEKNFLPLGQSAVPAPEAPKVEPATFAEVASQPVVTPEETPQVVESAVEETPPVEIIEEKPVEVVEDTPESVEPTPAESSEPTESVEVLPPEGTPPE